MTTCVVVDDGDNVATALRPIVAGEHVVVGRHAVTAAEAIDAGHKIALEAIPRGGDVRKFGASIGIASADIAPGRLVHVHNVMSRRAGAGAGV